MLWYLIINPKLELLYDLLNTVPHPSIIVHCRNRHYVEHIKIKVIGQADDHQSLKIMSWLYDYHDDE